MNLLGTDRVYISSYCYVSVEFCKYFQLCISNKQILVVDAKFGGKWACITLCLPKQCSFDSIIVMEKMIAFEELRFIFL